MMKRIFHIILCLSTLACLSSCSDQWNSHYDREGTFAEDNLWQYINNRSELQKFARILQLTGYDKVLSSDQMFTVWAPVDESFQVDDMSSERLLNEFVMNHVCRSAQIVPDNADSTFVRNIQVMNGKRIVFSADQEHKVTFGSVILQNSNLLCRNGILHTINGKEDFFDNIWEYLPKDSNLTQISEYLHSFDTTYFDIDASTEGGIVDGEIYYVDSVIYNDNPMLNRLGRLDDEKSDYLFLAPTNTAWEEAYERISPYFNYGAIEQASYYQDYYTKEALVANTVFWGYKKQTSPSDSLLSTLGRTFYDPARLMRNTTEKRMSNGYIYITDTLHILPEESWFLPIKIEAENSGLRESQYCSVENRDAKNASIKVSGGTYVEVSPTSTSNPTLTYTVRGTLSASYDIYCVFVPQRIANPNLKRVLPTKVRFQMSYLNAAGKIASINLGNATVDTEKMDTILVRKNFKFPTANYGLVNENVQFKIINNVSNRETAMFNRKMFIDCIYFQPVE
jgi:hypothetical protein